MCMSASRNYCSGVRQSQNGPHKEKIPTHTAKLFLGFSKWRTSAYFNALSRLSNVIRIKYKLLIVTFKALRTGTPGYLSDLLVKQKITKRTRSQSIDAPDRLIVPLYSGERSAGTSYSVAAPKLWTIVYQLTSDY